MSNMPYRSAPKRIKSLNMARTPFDLSFEDLVEAGAKASKAAREEAARAGVPLATIESSAPSSQGKRGSRKPSAVANRDIEPRRRLGR